MPLSANVAGRHPRSGESCNCHRIYRVPDVEGLKPQAADRVLGRRHFKVEYTALSNVCAGLPPHGHIIAQKPAAGKLVRRDSTVRLQTSCG